MIEQIGASTAQPTRSTFDQPRSGAPAVGNGPKPPKRRSPGGKAKNDPQHVAAARELRDRYLERFNSGKVPGGVPQGKYHVAVALSQRPAKGLAAKGLPAKGLAAKGLAQAA